MKKLVTLGIVSILALSLAGCSWFQSSAAVTKTGGMVDYQKDNIDVSFNLNEVNITPAFDLEIGKVSEMKLSPNEQFLYIATAQGGGTASFVYSLENEKVYYLGNDARGVAEWQADGKLKVENKGQFGEDAGKLLSVYESVSSAEPWILEKSN